jgi:hypothetical protein
MGIVKVAAGGGGKAMLRFAATVERPGRKTPRNPATRYSVFKWRMKQTSKFGNGHLFSNHDFLAATCGKFTEANADHDGYEVKKKGTCHD